VEDAWPEVMLDEPPKPEVIEELLPCPLPPVEDAGPEEDAWPVEDA
jgi:hypothetical protein